MSLGVEAANASIDISKPKTTSLPDPNPKYAYLVDKKENEELPRDNAKLADKPTSADAEKGTKDIQSVISQVGNGASFLQGMYPMMSRVSAVAGGGSQSSRKKVLEKSLYQALTVLVKKYNYDLVISAFDLALKGNNIKIIDEVYRDVIEEALSNLFKAAIEFGPNNIPIKTYLTVEKIGPKPTPVVTTVPDLYIQEYYEKSEDPNMGYIKWSSQNSTEYVFTERKIGDRYYTFSQQEILAVSEQKIINTLDNYIRDQNLTPQVLNDLMRNQDSEIEANSSEKNMGKGTGSGGLNALQLISSLVGFISVASNLTKSAQLPYSVLDSNTITSALSKHEKRMAELLRMKSMLKSASTPPSSMGGLTSSFSSLGGLNSVLGGLTGISETIGNISSLTGLTNIIGITAVAQNIAAVTASISTTTGKVNVSVRVPSILTSNII